MSVTLYGNYKKALEDWKVLQREMEREIEAIQEKYRPRCLAILEDLKKKEGIKGYYYGLDQDKVYSIPWFMIAIFIGNHENSIALRLREIARREQEKNGLIDEES